MCIHTLERAVFDFWGEVSSRAGKNVCFVVPVLDSDLGDSVIVLKDSSCDVVFDVRLFSCEIVQFSQILTLIPNQHH